MSASQPTPTEPGDTGKVSVVEGTIDAIKTMIVSGRFQAGERLPTERDLALTLGVSRNTVREAVRALSLMKVVESRQGAGTYVTSLAPSLLLDSVSLLVTLSSTATSIDLLAVRRVLESEAAAQAAARIDDADLARLDAILTEMRHDPQSGDGSVESVTEADLRFHSIIAQAAGNPVLAALVEALSDRTYRARVWRGYAESGVYQRAWHQHEAIYAALRDRDPQRAAAQAAAHVADVEAYLRTSSA
ncbi:FadR/GntR family transcriptional regulator [Streptomyces sp. NPDC056910]|uniref:FadR/GntR family transcriptional regulator n=1 Tax=Streptomyces sp. NPDC056910 TaxID=3345964 RepID=UPI003693F366